VSALNRPDPGHGRDDRRWPGPYSVVAAASSPVTGDSCPDESRNTGHAPRVTGHGPRATGHGRGFSLLEVLLVLAIIGVSAAVAAPRYALALGRYRADLAARRIVADLRLAQAHAKASSAPRTMSFSPAAGQYQLLNVPAPDGKPGDYTVVLSAAPYHAELMSVDFNGGTQVVFNGWGLPNAGGAVVVSAGSLQRTVVVEGATGRVSVP